MFIEIFNDLLEENNLNRKQFAEKSEIPYTTVIGWTTLHRLPDYAALNKIADFFDCSVDYLMGRQHNLGNNISQDTLKIENTLLHYFRKLDNDDKEIIIKLTRNLSSKK
jgi:transcriptional regulator with XRE-family HTH domain